MALSIYDTQISTSSNIFGQVDGEKKSLADVGYIRVGIDEGWEGCGQGVNKTQHYVNGTPAINSKFPDMKALVDYGHNKGARTSKVHSDCHACNLGRVYARGARVLK